jgi:ADP-ribose pyrophosphatase YjhB (NUDIX family)
MSEHKMRVAAKGLFFNSKGELLVVKSLNAQDSWSGPGGGVEEDESIFACVERELVEETGHYGKAQKIVFVQDFNSLKRGRQLELFIVGKIDESKEPVGSADHQYKFVNQDEFLKLNFQPPIMPFELRESNGIEYKTYLE